MSLNKFYIIILLMFANLIGFAQLDGDKQEDTWMEDNIFLDGEVTDYYTGKSISGVSISATVGGTVIANGSSDANGEYKLVLEYDKIYTITFSRGGLISKIITMNTSGVPDLKRQKVPDMVAEITMFKPNDCIKADILKAPIGRAIYYAKKNVMDWDMDYSMPRLEKLNKMLDKCSKEVEKAKEKEEQKEKDYNSSMKIANKAFLKGDWEDAIAAYTKATEIFSDRPEPKNKLKLIETEIAKKAEAEKQRAEEKARAEAEAIAQAEAEAAAKKAEEERIAKENAQAMVLAKTEAAAKEKVKAEAAAKKAEAERIAKEQKKAEALAKKEAEEKEKLEKEAAIKKAAEEIALKEESTALAQMKEEEKAKIEAQKEANKRADAEAKALADKLAAEKREIKERKAKEIAAGLAEIAEKERLANEINLIKSKETVTIEIEKQEESKTIEEPKESTIKFKRKKKTRHLYEKPNKHRPGKGPQPKKRIVF